MTPGNARDLGFDRVSKGERFAVVSVHGVDSIQWTRFSRPVAKMAYLLMKIFRSPVPFHQDEC